MLMSAVYIQWATKREQGIANNPVYNIHPPATHSHLQEYLDSIQLATGLAVVHLAALLASLVGPWEVCNGNEEEGVAGVGDTGKSVVPGRICQSQNQREKGGMIVLTRPGKLQ